MLQATAVYGAATVLFGSAIISRRPPKGQGPRAVAAAGGHEGGPAAAPKGSLVQRWRQLLTQPWYLWSLAAMGGEFTKRPSLPSLLSGLPSLERAVFGTRVERTLV